VLSSKPTPRLITCKNRGSIEDNIATGHGKRPFLFANPTPSPYKHSTQACNHTRIFLMSMISLAIPITPGSCHSTSFCQPLAACAPRPHPSYLHPCPHEQVQHMQLLQHKVVSATRDEEEVPMAYAGSSIGAGRRCCATSVWLTPRPFRQLQDVQVIDARPLGMSTCQY
jgi:hypothetical protein